MGRRHRQRRHRPLSLREEGFRQHRRADGSPKRAYVTRAAAIAACPHLDTYRCDECGSWHVASIEAGGSP